MSPVNSALSRSRWLPELDNHALVVALLVLGLAGALSEVVAGVFVPRMVLYLVALTGAAIGLVRRYRSSAHVRPPQ